MKFTLDRATLEKLLAHATSAARTVGHFDVPIAVGPLADDIDAIVHELSELLGNPYPIAASVPSARPTCDEPTELRSCPVLPQRKQLAEAVQ